MIYVSFETYLIFNIKINHLFSIIYLFVPEFFFGIRRDVPFSGTTVCLFLFVFLFLCLVCVLFLFFIFILIFNFYFD